MYCTCSACTIHVQKKYSIHQNRWERYITYSLSKLSTTCKIGNPHTVHVHVHNFTHVHVHVHNSTHVHVNVHSFL